MSLIKSASTVGGLTLVSRILGYVRDILIATTLGAGILSDAFFVAFRLPNIFRALSAEGAFNAAFVPLVTGKIEENGKEKAMVFASHICSFMLFFLMAITILMQIFMPAIMQIMAPGFSDNPEKLGLTIDFARIVFPYLVFVSIVSLISGILNSIGRFAIAASAPIWLNICMILSIIFLSKFTQTPAHALCWGVVAAGFVQLAWLLFGAVKNGIYLKISIPKIDSDVKTLLKRMIPGIIGSGVTQINLLINTIIATTMASAVSYLYYADRLVQFPLAIIGTAMGTVLLPKLSKYIKQNDLVRSVSTQNNAIEITLLLTIPASAAFFIIAEPIIAVMFERGEFTRADTISTAKALAAYAFGLPAFVLIKIFAPVFFAHADTKTPVKIAAICVIFNISLGLTLINYIGFIGLAVATATTAWLNCSLLCYVLSRKNMYKTSEGLPWKVACIIISSVVMAFAINLVNQQFSSYLELGLLYKITALVGLIMSGIIAFFAVAFTTKAISLKNLKILLKFD